MTQFRAGGSLSGDERITSPNGQYSFGVMADGKLAVGGPNGAEWDANIHDAPGARLDVQADGNLVLYDVLPCAMTRVLVGMSPGVLARGCHRAR